MSYLFKRYVQNPEDGKVAIVSKISEKKGNYIELHLDELRKIWEFGKDK